jgi:hypothetical protein
MKATKKDWLEWFLLISVIFCVLIFPTSSGIPIWVICWTGFICFILVKYLYIDKKFK